MSSPPSSQTSLATPGTETHPPAAPVRQPRRAVRPGGDPALFRVLSLLPFVAFSLVFALYPLVQLVRTALSDVALVDGAFRFSFAGPANFAELGSDGTAHYSFLITAVFILVTVPVTLALGGILAILVDRSVAFARVAHNILLWPAVITPVVVSVIWFLILSPNVGVLNKVLTSLHLPAQGWLAHAPGAIGSIMLVDVWHWTPLVFLLLYSALKGIDTDLMESARVDGASEWQVYTRIVLPLLRPAIFAAALIRLTMGAKAFDEMFLLTHGGPGHATTLVSLYIRDVFFDQLELGYGAALSMVVILAVGVALAVVLLGRKLGRLAMGGVVDA